MRIAKALLFILMLIFNYRVVAENLIGIYQQALLADPQLRIAKLKVGVGHAQKGQALGKLLPQISGTANWSTNKQNRDNFDDRSYKGTRYYVSLTQSLIDFAKFWDWRRAQEIENQYTAELLDAQHTLLYKVTEYYFSVLEAEDQLQLIQMEKQATETESEQVNKQFAKQLVDITDVFEVEARLDQLQADIIQAESNLIIARLTLKELTNNMPQQLDNLRDGIEYKELEGKLDDWIAVARSENPLLAAQQNAIEAASNNLAVQKSRYLPVVDLQLNYYDTDTGYQNTQTGQTQTQVAAINVNVPIFTGGTTTHRMFEAQGQLAISQEEYEAKIRAIVKETSDAFSASNANARRIIASKKTLASAIMSREAMQKGMKYGMKTIADVLRAQKLEFKAKKDLSKSKYEYIINRVRFLKAIGTLSEENLQEISHWMEK